MSIHYVYRKIYINKRTFDNKFEKDKQRIDFINNKDLMIQWGTITKETNYRNYDINNFNIAPLVICLDNSEGYFFHEDRLCSLWYGYLTRIYTKIEILVGEDSQLLDEVYYGYIDNIKNTYDKKSYITIQPCEYILNKFSIKDLLLHGTMTCEEILQKILNQKLIKLFVDSYNLNLQLSNIVIENIEKIEGSYWDIIKYICLISNSYVFFDKNILNVIPKKSTAGDTGIKLYSETSSTSGRDNIYSIGYYDDEGHKKLRLKFQDKNSGLYSVVKNDNILNKYLGLPDSLSEIEYVDLINIKDSYKKRILNELVDFWGTPRKSIEITTKFNNKLKLLKTLNISITDRSTRQLRWGHFYWGDGSRWTGEGPGFVIYDKKKWIIKSLKHNLNNWISTINLEEVF